MPHLTTQKQLTQAIKRLKKEKKAIILAHNYQRPEIYPVADFVGDSFGLAQAAIKTQAKIIVFCGVNFMAEMAALLNPSKKVLIPTRQAICPMAAMVIPQELKNLKKKHPQAKVVAYVNTTADVKALTDVCCTSANAVKVVNSLKAKTIIFIPDKHLGEYVQSQTKKTIIPWQGFCYVHSKITENQIKRAIQKHPQAQVLIHPECPQAVQKHADHILSTSGMIKHVDKSKHQEFIIGTEIGLVELLRLKFPKRKFYGVLGTCIQQKKINLENLYHCLKEEKNLVTVPTNIAKPARLALKRMLKLGRQD